MSEMTMVEVVARALCRLDIQIKRRWDTAPERLAAILPGAVDYAWSEYVDQARAAIAAMRKPTAEMLQALQTQWPGGTGSDETRWQCMVDAALRESPGEPQAHLAIVRYSK